MVTQCRQRVNQKCVHTRVIWNRLPVMIPLEYCLWSFKHTNNGFESRWSLDFFQASSFQLLKLENLLRWSFFTLIYNHISKIWIISYIRHINKPFDNSSHVVPAFDKCFSSLQDQGYEEIIRKTDALLNNQKILVKVNTAITCTSLLFHMLIQGHKEPNFP